VIEIDNGVIRPQMFSDFLSGDDPSMALDEHLQNSEGLLGQKYLAVFPVGRPQFTCVQVELDLPDQPFADRNRIVSPRTPFTWMHSTTGRGRDCQSLDCDVLANKESA
jgi:hypothetical protein